MNRSLMALAPTFREVAAQLIGLAGEAGVPVTIINTLRTDVEQADCLRRGVSWIPRSKHQDGLAIDLCPIACLTQKNWAPDDPAWQKLGLIGESLGLVWGGRWQQRDLGHFEKGAA